MLDYTFAKPHQHHTTESALSHLSHPPRSYAVIQHFSKASEIQCGSISVTVHIPKLGAVTVIYGHNSCSSTKRWVETIADVNFRLFIWHTQKMTKMTGILFLWRPLLEWFVRTSDINQLDPIEVLRLHNWTNQLNEQSNDPIIQQEQQTTFQSFSFLSECFFFQTYFHVKLTWQWKKPSSERSIACLKMMGFQPVSFVRRVRIF